MPFNSSETKDVSIYPPSSAISWIVFAIPCPWVRMRSFQ